MRADVLKGHLDGLLLAILEDGPQHGYAIIDALRERTHGSLDLPTGTVYPAVHRLAGEDPVTAADSAVAEFGRVGDLAGELSQEMAGAFAHRFGLALIATGPVVGLGWLTAFALRSGANILDQLRPVLEWLPGY